MSQPIYYINLDGRPDRRARMDHQLDRLRLAAHRVSATTPSDLGLDDIARYCDSRRVWHVRPNELACTASHMAAWSMMLASGAPQAVFLEDDAVLSARLPSALEHLGDIDALGLDLVRLEACWRARVLPATHRIGDGIVLRPFRSTPGGTSGYILSAAGAGKLLASSALRQRQLDLALYDPFRFPGRLLRRALLDPALIVQEGDVEGTDRSSGTARSDIVADISRSPASAGGKLMRALIDLGAGVRNSADHLRHVPKGITSRKISWQPD